MLKNTASTRSPCFNVARSPESPFNSWVIGEFNFFGMVIGIQYYNVIARSRNAGRGNLTVPRIDVTYNIASGASSSASVQLLQMITEIGGKRKPRAKSGEIFSVAGFVYPLRHIMIHP